MAATARTPLQRAFLFGLRLAAVIVSFVLSAYGVLYGFAGLIGLTQYAMGADEGAPPRMLGVSAMMAYAWIAWLVLGIAWAFQRRLHPWWPISGTVVGVACILFTFGFAIVFTLPAITMAIVFVTFHLSNEARQIAADRARRD